MIRGVIFDMDGTLVDSALDFDLMRREMDLPAGQPILEAIAQLPADLANHCRIILSRHEQQGADRATLLPGVAELCHALDQCGIHRAVATRNSRSITQAALGRLGLKFEIALTRDDGPVKPDPWPVLEICRQWCISPAETAVVGDFRFDVECGRAAGAHTVLLTHDGAPCAYPNHERADLVLNSLADYPRLLAWLETL